MKKKYFSLDERHYFKFLSGIYILLSGRKIVYVGKTQSLFSRILEHKKDKNFDCFRVLLCDEQDNQLMQHYEQRLIKLFKPKYNKNGFKAKTLFKVYRMAMGH